MNKKLLCLLMLVFSLGLTFTACSDDDDDPVKVEITKVWVDQGAIGTVKIIKGKGDYKVSSASEAIATASISGDVITITGVTAGETTLTVTDKKNKTVTLEVTVVGYAEQIAAIYEGTLDIPGMGVSDLPNEIVLSKGDNNNLKLSIETLTIPMGPEASIGVTGIAVKSVPVTKTGDKYTLTETTENIEVKIVGTDDPIPVPVTVKGTLENGKLVLDIKVAEVPLIGDLAVSFEGTKKAN